MKKSIGKKGFTLTETLVALILSTIIITTATLITGKILKNANAINASIELEENIINFQTSLRYIVSRHWTGLASITETSDTIYLNIAVPYAGDESSETHYATLTAFISHDADTKQLIFYFPDSDGKLTSKVIAENIVDFSVYPYNQWLFFSATFEYKGLSKTIKGTVKYF
ncbi:MULTISPECIES: prepilin-type N-terminal cleavage/methylation domain-containing protein [unclassified Kosmotoga]|uniref:prepilin-type N-terminal cleavage/methylation domain-containing protein n=1 Tax=unclassified Kosmotoga TaxID=2631489 RepID=UPI0007C54FF5|nr:MULTISPECIES: prepilin-type N-terminal cleavage/methylation domain-containing protein [unclassified Kosmotoga]MDI3524090.1 hypothetical protein [Kosmotoga sp.]OAA22538.1 hypothetical protein DU53_03885 [Kosmotoga sp. DU53]